MTGPSKADQVHARLKEQIELGELAPGEPLSELSLVARTGASRTPVREALRRLAAEGLVELAPRLGARVSRVSARGVRDLYEFRQLLESAAVRQATATAAADLAVRQQFADLRAGFAGLRDRAPSGERSRDFYEQADRFDRAVVAATRNEHLRRTIADLRPHTARLRHLSHLDPRRTDVSVGEHLALCDAVLAGDADAAAALVEAHLAGSVATIFANLGGDLEVTG